MEIYKTAKFAHSSNNLSGDIVLTEQRPEQKKKEKKKKKRKDLYLPAYLNLSLKCLVLFIKVAADIFKSPTFQRTVAHLILLITLCADQTYANDEGDYNCTDAPSEKTFN